MSCSSGLILATRHFSESSRQLRLFWLSIVSGWCLLGKSVFAQPSFQHAYYIVHNDTLPYRLYVPDTLPTKPLPLLIFLHGAGSRGMDNERHLTHFRQAAAHIARYYPCVMLAPQCPKDKRWVEVDWQLRSHQMPAAPSRPLAMSMQLLDSLLSVLPIDTNRLYITGLSMGGYGTWDWIQRQPWRFAAAVPICGGADTHTAPQLKHLPIWIFHGALDAVVPVSRSRDMYHALIEAGNRQVRYTEYPDVYHDSWKRAYASPELWQWLFSQAKNATAKH